VTPEELVATRHRLGLTPESLAAELNLTPAVILAWERGRIRPTRRAQRWLAWRGAMLDRDDALAASGLPECAALRHVVATTREEGRSRSGSIVLAHMATCDTCLARRRFLEERFPPLPPPPLPLPIVVMLSTQRAVERAWRWIRGARG
jgi:transcriptional regulator with XRE-family HTH domain